VSNMRGRDRTSPSLASACYNACFRLQLLFQWNSNCSYPTEVFNRKDSAINKRFLSQPEPAGQLTARLYSNACLLDFVNF